MEAEPDTGEYLTPIRTYEEIPDDEVESILPDGTRWAGSTDENMRYGSRSNDGYI